MNPYLEFVQSIADGVEKAKAFEVSGSRQPVESDPKVLLFSPHPDDECITGLLPLRLMRETGRQIVNIPVTFGSKVERQAERAVELEKACCYLGWQIFRRKEGLHSLEVGEAVGILAKFQPEIIFMPHAGDWNSRHVSTHFLVVEALASMPPQFCCQVVETEFWRALDDPNLMVEGCARDVADLVAATSLHAGEVARSPYHLLLPAWMQDNVRRGSELLGGQGGVGQGFGFATLYRSRQWRDGAFAQVIEDRMLLAANADLNEIFAVSARPASS